MRTHFQPLVAVVVAVLLMTMSLTACKNDPKQPATPPQTTVRPTDKPLRIPAFDADSSYAYVARQVDFGPRVMGSQGHTDCKAWLIDQFKARGARVISQDFSAKVYTGQTFAATNIIAQFNPDVSDRIVLAAHWDTRHIADSPLSDTRQNEPILGADDGGSGVAVLLELARQLQAQPVGIGVDIVLFDAEDYGHSGGAPETYCLGSQYWSRNLHTPYKHRYGILLDMVGAKGAQFPVEGFSWKYAQPIVQKVWTLARSMGKGNYFIDQAGGSITDDHYFVNTIAQIPMIDIINMSVAGTQTFGAHWHTHNDNMDIIDKNTLRAVGQVLTAVVYREDVGKF